MLKQFQRLEQQLTRRHFFRAALGLSILVFSRPADFAVRSFVRSESDRCAAKLAGYFKYTASASHVGRRYLTAVPDEANRARLVDLICAGMQTSPVALTRMKIALLRRRLSAQQREDFRCRRIVNLEGWLLSQTEVRLCALSVLT